MGVSRYFVCKGGNVEGLAAVTMFWNASEESQIKALKLITNCYTFSMFFAYAFTSAIEIALQIDLALTLQRPFAQTRKRQFMAFAIALVYALATAIAILVTDKDMMAPINYILFFG